MEYTQMELLKFSTPWCGPCKDLSEELRSRYPDIKVIEINVGNDMDTAKRYDIRSVPTLVRIDEEGVENGRIVGFNKVKLKEFLYEEIDV